MKVKPAAVFTAVFSACGIAWGAVPPSAQQDELYARREITNRVYLKFPAPIDPQNRIVEGKLYGPNWSPLWMDITTNLTEYCSSLKVTGIGKSSISCDVFKEMWNDGGRWGVYHVIGEEYVKTILIYNHPAHDAITTGALIYEGRFKQRGRTPLTEPFLAMRVANWRTNNVVLEAYDCGLPDTAQNRKRAGIAIPTPTEIAAAQEEIATALKALDEKARAVAAEAEAAKRKVEAEKAAEAAAQQKAAEAAAAEAEAATRKIEAEKAAKAAALAHLPSFTNQIVTINALNGAVYTNIALVRASADGIIYRTTVSVGGGFICYTNLSPDALEAFGIDTNCISIARERAETKASAGPAPAAATRGTPPSAKSAASQKGYGKRR